MDGGKERGGRDGWIDRWMADWMDKQVYTSRKREMDRSMNQFIH